jgi:hypothetical protein
MHGCFDDQVLSLSSVWQVVVVIEALNKRRGRFTSSDVKALRTISSKVRAGPDDLMQHNMFQDLRNTFFTFQTCTACFSLSHGWWIEYSVEVQCVTSPLLYRPASCSSMLRRQPPGPAAQS